MLGFRPRIFHKGLVLLAVPVLFELVIAAALLDLQHYYGEALNAEALRKRIVFHTNKLWYHNMNVTTTGLGALVGREPDLIHSDRTYNEYAELKKLVALERQQLELLDKIMLSHDRSFAALQQLKPFVSDSGGTLTQILALKNNLRLCKQITEADIETGKLIREFREYELAQSSRAADRVGEIARHIQLLLAVSIFGSLVIAGLLFRYFMQGIHRGVNAITQNIENFRTKRQLLPAIAGADEIALLDARFHDMAEKVADAQRIRLAFVATMSNEIRTPISSARQYLEQLSAGVFGQVPSEPRALARKAEQTLSRVVGLLNDLLALEERGVHRVPISPGRCRLSDIIAMSVDTVAPFADRNGIRLEREDPELEVNADSFRIVQVLVNLLSNAIKFSPPGSVVTIGGVKVEDQVEVKVTDRGRGIPRHRLEAVFERFEQVDAADATGKGGSGLGLPICREIIELHGGTIGVESEEGQGSTFWFCLPAAGMGGR